MPDTKPTRPQYAGSISRWCDLTGNVPDVGHHGHDKTSMEFEAFNRYLDKIDADMRAEQELGL